MAPEVLRPGGPLQPASGLLLCWRLGHLGAGVDARGALATPAQRPLHRGLELRRLSTTHVVVTPSRVPCPSGQKSASDPPSVVCRGRRAPERTCAGPSRDLVGSVLPRPIVSPAPLAPPAIATAAGDRLTARAALPRRVRPARQCRGGCLSGPRRRRCERRRAVLPGGATRRMFGRSHRRCLPCQASLLVGTC